MNKKPSYKIIEFRMLPVDDLQPHPEAIIPIEQDDAAAIGDSIQGNGIIQPILVMRDHATKAWHIVDGVNRWKSAKSATLIDIPCLIIECSDVKAVVLECLSIGRKRTTGQRIMVYLEAHKQDVLKTWSQNSKMGNEYFAIRSRDRMDDTKGSVINDFTAESIAKIIHASSKDVRAGISLMAALEAKSLPPKLEFGGCDLEAYKTGAVEARLKVMSGALGIRKWAPSLSGKISNKGKGMADVQYDQLARPAAVTLKNCFDHWGEIPWKDPIPGSDHNEVLESDRDRAEAAIGLLLSHVPDQFRHIQRDIITDTWTPAQRSHLLAALQAKAVSEKNAKKGNHK